jgi:hypothetical protein
MKTGNLELIAGHRREGATAPMPTRCNARWRARTGSSCDADGTVFIGDSESHRVRVLKRK